MTGVFLPCDGVIVILMTVAYLLCPESVFGRKTEHGRMVLCAMSVYAFILMALHFVFYEEFEMSGGLHLVAIALAAPVLFLTHVLYPYRQERRDRHVTFFAGFISVGEVLSVLAVWYLVANSNM
ncbi:MAG: hypothetical protein HUK01_05460 [Bacteroidaceae bacterium]|nr:hypothetical protein [Bacteroidaceae bacterium]